MFKLSTSSKTKSLVKTLWCLLLSSVKVKNINIKNESCEMIRDAVIVLSENKIKESEAIIGISLLEGGMESGNAINIKKKSKETIC